MGFASLGHWLLLIVVIIAGFASPIMGIIRGVKNGSIINALLSAALPVYGFIYFFVARQPSI